MGQRAKHDACVRGRWRGAVVEDVLGELIRLDDPPGTNGHVVSLRVMEPPPGRAFLDCEFIVETETVRGGFPVYMTSDDLDDWEEALGALAGNRFVSWLNSGRTVRFQIKPVSPDVIAVSVHDGPSVRGRPMCCSSARRAPPAEPPSVKQAECPMWTAPCPGHCAGLGAVALSADLENWVRRWTRACWTACSATAGRRVPRPNGGRPRSRPHREVMRGRWAATGA
ncbi:DUF5959 family protein [Streptomyces roseolus]|uniref:DUF5959 family protein n=1 Tax=Streptomyces roseolus TaxID=67358 RepID=UPI00378D164C